MNNLNLKPTATKIISENYPYGFREKTTKTDYIEFSVKHGFRHCSTTVNPKTGRVNNPKKSTYYEIMLLGIDEVGHCKTLVLDFYDNERKDKTIKFLSEDQNFNLFTIEQMKFIYEYLYMQLKVDIKARVVYCGADFEVLKPLYDEQIKIVIEGMKNPTENRFKEIKFDWAAIEATKVEGYQPFKITNYEISIDEGIKDIDD
jgi:hypothetical protein